HPLFMTLWQNLVIVAVLLPFVRVPDDLRSLFLACAVMGIVHSTVAPVLYFKGLQRVTANKAAILGYLEPVSAILLGALFLGETITSRNILGGTLILLSGYITARDSGEASLGA
ncbi:MAG TPA: DMT family transporter, partial [Thermodesulfovibrionales bacterium]|nr:DMT family transporter [Thermodesulfovibrionales bacterium]